MLPATPVPNDNALHAALQKDLDQYLSARAKPEHISAISLSISLHGQSQNINLTAGTTKYAGGGDPAAPAQLWQIGSNTKAFTAAIILQLEAEGKLNINQTVGRFLPQYPAWKDITIHRLLDMTSGIPGYDLVDQMLADYAAHPKRNLTAAQLIAYVYPGAPHAPPATKGYAYSNTGYILAELIIEKVTHNSLYERTRAAFLTFWPWAELDLLFGHDVSCRTFSIEWSPATSTATTPTMSDSNLCSAWTSMPIASRG